MGRGSARGNSPKGKPGGKRASAQRRTSPGRAIKAVRRRRSPAVTAKSKAARLAKELDEAMQRQAATSDILKVIARSPSGVQAVFDQILDSIKHLIGSDERVIILAGGDGMLRLGAAHSPRKEALHKLFPIPQDTSASGLAIRERRLLAYADVLSDPAAPAAIKAIARRTGAISVAIAPLLTEDRAIGTIIVTRSSPEPFSEKERALLGTFADQAVIAIENARLFNETKEALERQTATADVLQVISSSPGELGPVFEAMLKNAVGICCASFGTLLLYEGDRLRRVARMAAQNVPQSYAPDQETPPHFIAPFDGAPSLGRLVETKALVHIADIATEHPDDLIYKVAAARTVLIVPMLKESELVGAFAVYRKEVQEFSDKQVELLENFAAQAVIAVENTRLLNELRQRTNDLTESLERQTATADILKVIASSPSDVQPVFDAIAERANTLIGGYTTTVLRINGDVVELAAFTPLSEEADAVLQATFPIPIKGNQPFEMVQRGEMSEIDDTEMYAHLPIRNLARARGFRSRLLVPLKSEGGVIGAISVTRVAPGNFAEHHVQLLQTFADQAVIAIQNARLFNELQARTRDLTESLEQQTATAEILSSISGSMHDTRPVFEAIVRSLRRLFGTRFAVVQTLSDGVIDMPAADGEPGFERLTQRYPRPLARDTVGGLAMLEKRTVQLQPVRGNPAVPPSTQDFARDFGFDAVLFTPMLSGEKVVGAIGVARHEPIPFDSKQIALISSFASQAVIAIENTRLLKELRQRTEALTQSLEELRTAQDRLIQTEKLASLGQLTAGIAHEIKNPLNFVNNFSALSAELTGELNDALKGAALTDKTREEVDELTKLLKENLEKVVQHGKRADSIVKNMLLHSREGAGEQRSADVNALVEESLNLAYHGARAEKLGFHITLQRDFDASAGAAELFPQEIMRALLNLISNGFYAATRRKGETGFEPTLLATTRNLGGSVEIRIRDNGTGIPPEVREKIFNPFFTTKPAGEGTGLGLSMTHDIVVKQHGGRIDVETTLGEFTEFIVVLPRAGSPQPRASRQSARE